MGLGRVNAGLIENGPPSRPHPLRGKGADGEKLTGEEGYPGTRDCFAQMEVECASPWTKNRGQ